MNIPIELKDFLVWVGSPVVLAGILVYVLNRWSGFQDLDSDKKRVVAVALSFIVGGLLYNVIKAIPAETIASLNDTFKIGMVLALTVLGNQGLFALTRKPQTVDFEADFSSK